MRLPDYLHGLFHRLSDSQSKVLRNSKTDLRISMLKTCYGQRNFEFRGAHIWNNLSNEAKDSWHSFGIQVQFLNIDSYYDATMAPSTYFRYNRNFPID